MTERGVTAADVTGAVTRANVAWMAEISARTSGTAEELARAHEERRQADAEVERLQRLLAQQQRDDARPMDTPAPAPSRLWKTQP